MMTMPSERGVRPTTTGGPQSRRSGLPQRRQIVDWAEASTTPEYTTAGRSGPGTNTPDQQPKESGPPGVGEKAMGSSSQWARSLLVAWPQAIRPWTGACGLCW